MPTRRKVGAFHRPSLKSRARSPPPAGLAEVRERARRTDRTLGAFPELEVRQQPVAQVVVRELDFVIFLMIL